MNIPEEYVEKIRKAALAAREAGLGPHWRAEGFHAGEVQLTAAQRPQDPASQRAYMHVLAAMIGRAIAEIERVNESLEREGHRRAAG